LVRQQFDEVHQWSAARGELVQVITGIPYYYRLFGYEMAMTLGGGRVVYLPQIPALKEGAAEPYQIRPVTAADLPFIANLYDQGCQRWLVKCEWDEALWRYELFEKSPQHVNRLEWHIIQTPAGEPVGYLGHPPYVWNTMLVASAYELKSSVSWTQVTPTVMRYLRQAGEVLPPGLGDQKKPLDSIGFWLGTDHPVYEAYPDRLGSVRKPYAWYVRVPDLPAFLRQITPVLEKRLAASLLAGYTGEARITFYRGGLRLVFDQGFLTTVEPWRPAPVGHVGDAAFPELTFLLLLFGYRSLEELRYAFPDIWANEDTTVLLEILFPKRASNIYPIS
jgi:hypothetical protein